MDSNTSITPDTRIEARPVAIRVSGVGIQGEVSLNRDGLGFDFVARIEGTEFSVFMLSEQGRMVFNLSDPGSFKTSGLVWDLDAKSARELVESLQGIRPGADGQLDSLRKALKAIVNSVDADDRARTKIGVVLKEAGGRIDTLVATSVISPERERLAKEAGQLGRTFVRKAGKEIAPGQWLYERGTLSIEATRSALYFYMGKEFLFDVSDVNNNLTLISCKGTSESLRSCLETTRQASEEAGAMLLERADSLA